MSDHHGPRTPYRLVIEAGRTEKRYFADLWQYRELFVFLAWRDILVRYKQTVIGAAWALIRPFLTMLAFSFIFGKMAHFPSNGVPYPILVFAALLPWQFFSSALSESSNSLMVNANMISKVYFPRMIVPVSAIVVCLVDFAISFGVLVGLMGWYHFIPSWRMVLLPLLIFIAFLAAAGAGFWLSALSVKYRDFRYVVPFIVQIGLYISPVGFASTVIPPSLRFLYSLNPMVGVIDGFRWAILGANTALYIPGFIASLVVVAVLFLSGIHYFRRTERAFADVI